jgi:hypothetical protein
LGEEMAVLKRELERFDPMEVFTYALKAQNPEHSIQEDSTHF